MTDKDCHCTPPCACWKKQEHCEALVKMVRECLSRLPKPYDKDCCEHGYLKDSVDEPCPYIECEDRELLDLRTRAEALVGEV